MEESRSPCLVYDCDLKGEDKKNERCFNCKVRVEYAKAQKRSMEKAGVELVVVYSLNEM
jgi:hypothetical protein